MMPGLRKISSVGRSELTTSQMTGYSMIRPTRLSSTCLITLFQRGLPEARASRRRSRGSMVACGPATATKDDVGASIVSVIVENPILGGPEVDGGERPDDEQQHPGESRGVAHVEVREAP